MVISLGVGCVWVLYPCLLGFSCVSSYNGNLVKTWINPLFGEEPYLVFLLMLIFNLKTILFFYVTPVKPYCYVLH